MSMNNPFYHLRSIWYHSKPSDISHFPNQFLGWVFFAVAYSKTAQGKRCVVPSYYLVVVYSRQNTKQAKADSRPPHARTY